MSLARMHHRLERLFCLLVGSLLLGVMAQAQVVNEAGSERRPPIDLKLSTTLLVLCTDSSIPLDLEMTNRGSDVIKIDKVDLWSNIRYGYLGDRSADRGGGRASFCDHCRGDLVVLRPDQSYQSSFKFPLDTDFFKDAGKYEISLAIEGVSSNKLTF